jgi:hypothetical protein
MATTSVSPPQDNLKEGFIMTDEELIKDFWINLRAEEQANEVADSELDSEGHWAAFESAILSADMEWFANYEGHCIDDLKGPLIDEARKLLANWHKTDREVISSMPFAPPDDPVYTSGFRIGMTRLRNSSTKPIKGDK